VKRLALVDQMTTAWWHEGRTPCAVQALRSVASADTALAALVAGPCPTPWDLVEHLRQARGTASRNEAARIISVLLREGRGQPDITRLLVQALVPGILGAGAKLRWGQGGEWQNLDEFVAELFSTAWCTITEWSGEERPYAALDLLSAIRMRVRRQLFRAQEQRARLSELERRHEAIIGASRSAAGELSAQLVELGQAGMPEEAWVLYVHRVLGFTLGEVADITGHDRTTVTRLRDRGADALVAA
jgi:hypothetical protein